MPDSPGAPPQRGRRAFLILTGLSVVVAGLVVALVALQNREPPPLDVDELGGPPKPKIYRFEIDSVVKVELRGPAREPFTIELIDDVWTSSYQRDVPIDRNRAYDLQATFGSLFAERIIESNPTNLALYGLDPPQVVGIATRSDGTTVELRLGNRTPSGTWYVMKPGDTSVYSVWVNHGNNLHYTIADVRKDELPVATTDLIEYVYIRKPDGEVLEIGAFDEADPRFYGALTRLLVLQPYAGWYDIDTHAFESFRQQLGGLRIERVVSDERSDAAEYGLAPARAEVRIRDAQGTERHILLGAAREGEVFFQVAGRDPIYAGRSSAVSFLAQDPFELISKLLLLVNVGLVSEVRVSHPGGEHTFVVTHAGSGDDATQSFQLDQLALDEAVGRWVYRQFIGMTADSPPEAARLAAARQAPVEVSIAYELREPPHRLALLLRPYDSQFYLSEQEGRGQFLVDRAKVEDMLAALRDPAGARP